MKISTQTDCFSGTWGEEKAIVMFSDIGYDALDYSMFDISSPNNPLNSPDFECIAFKLKRIADECSIVFNQTHAPFPSYIANEDDYNRKTFQMLIRSIIVTSILGAEYVIIHPIALTHGQLEFNIDFFNRLADFCKEYGVKIALENMFGWDNEKDRAIRNVCSTSKDFIELLDSFDSTCFTACLDVGHAGLIGEKASDMIRELGHDRLKTLHIHDNDFIKDKHQLPFTQDMDWNEIMKALKDINYDGYLTFEADRFLYDFPSSLRKKASEFMLEIGHELVRIYESF